MKNLNLVIFTTAILLSQGLRAGDSTSANHGDGLPSIVGEDAFAVQYREDFMTKHGITSYEKYGITHFENNKIGLGLVKSANRNENVFKHILSKTSKTKMKWNSGKQLIERLKEYSDSVSCIPKVVSASHGWASHKGGGDWHGLSGRTRNNGFYASEEARPKKWGASRTSEDLAAEVKEGNIKFCNKCIIQFYACNVSTKFAKSVAKASGCQVVLATGKASPLFRSSETQLDVDQMYNGHHYWQSGAAFWDDRGVSSWYRVTPKKTPYGEIVEFIEENLGDTYLAL
ncbi:MAG: hypothetical protein ACJAT2_000293 [Bacteriovoracaceae bacterium]|jgi:hypothetical protein